MKKENKKLKITANKKIVVFSLIALALLIIGSTSYAYFTAVIEGNDTAKQTSVTSGTMSLKLEGTVDVNVDSAMPGTTVEMPFNVTNTGSIDTSYAIALTGIQNTFADKSDLVYTIEDKAGNIIKSQTVYPSPASVNDVVTLVPVMTIAAKEKQEYIMKVTFLEKNEPQNDNQDKKVSGKIQIYDVSNDYLINRILATSKVNEDITDFSYNAIPYDFEINKAVSINASSRGGICVTNSLDNIGSNGSFYLEMSNSTCNVTNPGEYIGWYTFGYNDAIIGHRIFRIKEASGTTITKVDEAKFAVKEGQGIVKTKDDDGDTYIFRGNIDNNYVDFAGYLWRIVRINGDGTIRLIAEDSVGSQAFNTSAPNADLSVGYTYNNDHMCTLSNPCTSETGTSSTVKTYLENWYNDNLIDYEENIAIGKYCNDTSKTNSNYNAPNRSKPTLKCLDTNQTYGGLYNLKIGLLSVDELTYSGMNESGNSSSTYLAKDYYWYTMSPYSSGVMYSSYYNKDCIDIEGTTSESKIRPVINLKSDITITDGDGTAENPYVVG